MKSNCTHPITIYLVDPDESMLSKAAKNLNLPFEMNKNIPIKQTNDKISIKFLNCLVQDLKLADFVANPIDIVTSSFVFHHIPLPGKVSTFKVLSQIMRGNKKGAFMIADFMAEKHNAIRRFFGKFEEIWSSDMILGMLKDAGFVNVRSEYITRALLWPVHMYMGEKL